MGKEGKEVAVTSAACNYCKTLTISVTSRWASAKWQINKNKLNSNSIIKKIYIHTHTTVHGGMLGGEVGSAAAQLKQSKNFNNVFKKIYSL